MRNLISIVIPARNEQHLTKTIKDLLEKSIEDIEIIVVLDGYWPDVDDIVSDKRVQYIHFGESRGMRNAINSGVAIARGEFIMKSDGHCMFDHGFDKVLKDNMKKNWVVIPRRYALDVDKWEIEKRSDEKYPIDVMFLNDSFQGVPTKERKENSLIRSHSFQGSCWFMYKDYFNELNLLDEEVFGPFWQEAQEIGIKCFNSGGEVMRNTKTFYAHFHKTKGRGYSLQADQEKTREAIRKLYNSK